LLDDEPEPTVSESVDSAYCGEVISAGLERRPRDVEELRLWTLTCVIARALSEKKTQSNYDEYLHIGFYAFFDSCANAAISEGLDVVSKGPLLSPKKAVTVAFIIAGNRKYVATEEAACSRLGFLRLTKGRQSSTYADRVSAEFAHERFCRPRPTAVSGPLDALRQAFIDRNVEINLHAANKAAVGDAFARVTHDKPPSPYTKAHKAAANKRKAAGAAAAAARATPIAKNTETTRPPPRKLWCGPPRRFMLPSSLFMIYRVRGKWREWERIGASAQVVHWIRLGVHVKFQRGVRPRPFNYGMSMLNATPAQLEFLAIELPRFEACGAR
jgi:hypothetical protein